MSQQGSTHTELRSRARLRISIALIAIAVTLALGSGSSSGLALPLIFPIVVAVALLGGLWPGVFASLVASILFHYFPVSKSGNVGIGSEFVRFGSMLCCVMAIDLLKRQTPQPDFPRILSNLQPRDGPTDGITNELRLVASHAHCILYRTDIEGAEGWEKDLDGSARKFTWTTRVQDDAAAQKVLPLDVAPGQTYVSAWLPSRLDEDIPLMRQTSSRALISGDKSFEQDFRCIDKNGRVIWLHETMTLEKIGPGRWRGFGVCTNISDRKAAEEAVRATEQRFALFMRHLPGLAFIKDSRGRVKFINETHRLTMGWQENQWQDKSTRELFPSQFAQVMEEHDRQVMETGQPLQALEVLPSSAGEHTFLVSKFPIADPADGEIVLGGICIDVTDRTRAEELVQFQKTMLESVIEASRDGLLLVGKDGKWLSVNKRFTQLWKTPPDLSTAGNDEAALIAASQMVKNPEEFLIRVRDLYNHPTEKSLDRLEMTDGRILERESVPVIGPTGVHYGRVWFFHDITLEEQTREGLRSMALELTLTEERERRRIASALHDNIGQILAMSQVKLDLLAKRSKMSESLGEVSQMIGEAISEVRSLTVELSPPVLYEAGFEAAVAWLIDRTTKRFQIDLGLTITEGLAAFSEESSVLLFQAVRELLNNLVKHSKATRGAVEIGRKDGAVTITVRDNGVGMDLALLKERQQKGECFGLFSIRERLRYLGGRLEWTSQPGQGSTFVLSVPDKNGH